MFSAFIGSTGYSLRPDITCEYFIHIKSTLFCLNNRYGLDLIWTVLVMAEGFDTGEMPSFDPSPSSDAKKRPTSSSDGSEC